MIDIERVTFGYPGHPPVLRNVSLAVDTGQVVALVGRSGAGKSTILRLVNRLIVPTAGSVSVDGRDTRTWDAIALRRRIGYVLQEVGLFPHLTVGENVAMVPSLEGWPPARIEARVAELLALVGLDPRVFATRWPHELSGGQRQRVGVARALGVDPPILLMDEPFGAVDPVTRHELHEEFWRIQAAVRKTVMIVTHDMREALSLADWLGIIDAGELVAYGPAAEIAASPDPRVARLLAATRPVRHDVPGHAAPDGPPRGGGG